ncbi:unnamed protein product [Oikopleura dioica]|uniref:Uncharacterized protein n=1 Tax=Oikopleura dioica TaxID=34765 RepID=E4XWU2_OIKDI|nr:unnamed protein product [Oikopleura dioica]
MSVGETQHPPVQVAGRGMIDPGRHPRLSDHEARVFDAARVFVDEHRRPGRRRVLDLGQPVPAGLVGRVRRVVHVGAHRDAADALDLAQIADRRAIGRALVDFGGAVVGVEHPALDVGGRGVGPGIARDPGLGGGHPTFASPAGGGRVRREVVVVVIDVEQPADLELAIVVEAGDLVGLGLRPAERGQKHRRENRDDGDDHQQLEERETGAPVGGPDGRRCRACAPPCEGLRRTDVHGAQGYQGTTAGSPAFRLAESKEPRNRAGPGRNPDRRAPGCFRRRRPLRARGRCRRTRTAAARRRTGRRAGGYRRRCRDRRGASRLDRGRRDAPTGISRCCGRSPGWLPVPVRIGEAGHGFRPGRRGAPSLPGRPVGRPGCGPRSSPRRRGPPANGS